MPQEMTYAQALSEARQIIVQQSNRIKTDLEKIVALQDTLASQSTKVSQSERIIQEQSAKLSQAEERVAAITSQLEQVTVAREQADAIIDRQGQRLTQSQSTIAELEARASEMSEQINRISSELESLRQQLPTQEDAEALSALSSLLMTKKVSVPAISGSSASGNSSRRIGPSEDRSSGQPMRIAPSAVAA